MPEAPLRVLLLSSGTTFGQRVSDTDFEQFLVQLGMTVVSVRPNFLRVHNRVSHAQVVDLVEAIALRRAAQRHLACFETDIVILATTTASFLLPARVLRRSALRFDALACENRLGRLSLVSRLLERRAMRHLRVLMPMSSVTSPDLGRMRFLSSRRTVVPMPPALPDDFEDTDVQLEGCCLCYAGNPWKKGLDLVAKAWAAGGDQGRQLVVAGIDESVAHDFLSMHHVDIDGRFAFVGQLSSEAFRGEQAKAAIYIAGSRHEDYGMAQLEAMHAGMLVVTVPSTGPFEARRLIESVDPALVSERISAPALAATVRYALGLTSAERHDRVERCRELLGPYRRQGLGERAREQLVPALTVLCASGGLGGRRGSPSAPRLSLANRRTSGE